MLEKLQEQLRRRLTEKKQQFLLERKKALLVEKKKKQKDWEDKGDASHALVLLPHYVYDQENKIYRELPESIPPKELYKCVGYNNLETVRDMMKGSDAEKRTGDFVPLELKRSRSQKPGAQIASPRSEVFSEYGQLETEAEDRARMLKISNKHYRKFYEDELENNEELFHDKVFTTVDVVRG